MYFNDALTLDALSHFNDALTLDALSHFNDALTLDALNHFCDMKPVWAYLVSMCRSTDSHSKYVI